MVHSMVVVGTLFVVHYQAQDQSMVEVWDMSQENPNGQFVVRGEKEFVGETLPLNQCKFPGDVIIHRAIVSEQGCSLSLYTF